MANVRNGEQITLSTSETVYELVGDREATQVVFITLVSGTVQATAANRNTAPVLGGAVTYATWSTAGDKFPLTVHALSNIRARTTSAGVITVDW